MWLQTDEMIDAVIIGGGHNGLTCAFYLARAGMKVTICEAREVIGGAAVTEEFAPGFRNSTASYTVSLLQPKVIADMDLPSRGYRVIERPISNFLPLDSDYMLMGGGLEASQAQAARFITKPNCSMRSLKEVDNCGVSVMMCKMVDCKPKEEDIAVEVTGNSAANLMVWLLMTVDVVEDAEAEAEPKDSESTSEEVLSTLTLVGRPE